MEHADALGLAVANSDHAERVTELQPAILYALEHCDKDDAFVEFGVQRGGSTRLIAWHLQWAEHYGPFFSVENEREPHGLKFDIAEIGFQSWIPCFGQSERDFLENCPLPMGSCAFMYFDADHRMDYVAEDMQLAAPYLRYGALVAVDDVNEWPRIPEVPGFQQFNEIETDEGPIRGSHGHHIAFYRRY